MILVHSIRLRMMFLFCAVVGLLLAFSFAGTYVLFNRVVRDQLDRRLQETAGPIIADQISEPKEMEDVDHLNIPDEYFEVLDRSGNVL